MNITMPTQAAPAVRTGRPTVTSETVAPQNEAAAHQENAADSVTLSASSPSAEPAPTKPKGPPSGLARIAGRTLKSLVLGLLPAAATCAGLALGGPSVAGLCLAGGIIGAGLVGVKMLSGELNARDAFGVGGWLGVISGAAGMMGPVGVGLMAVGILARQVIGEAVYAADYGEIAGKLA